MIRSNTLVEEYEVVSQHDDAVDADAADFEHKWKLYRDGMGPPPLKPGGEPSYFKLRHLSSSERHCLAEKASEGGGLFLAVRLGLVAVRNYEHNGKPLDIKPELMTYGGAKFRVASRESLDAIPWIVQIELGALVLERSQARPS